MKSLRRHEGYLLVDNRVSSGISDKLAVAMGMPVGSGRGLFESPTYTCSHCQFVVVINPERTRERAYCAKCDHYICDKCGAIYGQTRECNPVKKVMDQLQEQAARAEQRGQIIIPS